jgi:hypothetical protein
VASGGIKVLLEAASGGKNVHGNCGSGTAIAPGFLVEMAKHRRHANGECLGIRIWDKSVDLPACPAARLCLNRA